MHLDQYDACRALRLRYVPDLHDVIPAIFSDNDCFHRRPPDWASWFRHSLKERLDVSSTAAEINKWCHLRISDRPQGKAGNELVKLLSCLHLCDEVECNASGYWSACHDAALASIEKIGPSIQL